MGVKEIEIKIDPTGQIYIEVKGAKGAECITLTQWLEDALGGLIRRDLKPDYYQSEVIPHPSIQAQQR